MRIRRQFLLAWGYVVVWEAAPADPECYEPLVGPPSRIVGESP